MVDSTEQQFLDMASLMDERYFENKLNWTDEMYEEISKQKTMLEHKIVEQGGSLNDFTAQEVLSFKPQELAAYVLGDKYKGLVQRCPHEMAEIHNLYRVFAERYDLEDPRAFIIFKQLVTNMLSVFRLERYVQQKGSMMTQFTKEGMPYEVVNPAEEAKRRFSETVVNAVARLDAIFEGNKIHAVVEDAYKPVEYKALFAKKPLETITTSSLEYNENDIDDVQE